MYGGRIVESGSRADVLSTARHPYTRGLLRSIPALARPGEPLEEIPGTVPAPAEWPPGCRFASRCARVLPECAEHIPTQVECEPGHQVHCFAVAQESGA
jgi:oligopeptide/dipeptide ABC transporter ATP-binding protein